MENAYLNNLNTLDIGAFLNEVIKRNLEMDNLLSESEYLLATANSDLEKIDNEIQCTDIEFKPSTSAVSERIDEDIDNVSDISNTDTKPTNNIKHDTVEEISKINDKPVITLTPEEEHDYLYIDTLNSPFKVTVINNNNDDDDDDDDDNNLSSELKLKQNHFEGCSKNFSATDFTITVRNENIETEEIIVETEEEIVRNSKKRCDDETIENLPKKCKLDDDNQLSVTKDYSRILFDDIDNDDETADDTISQWTSFKNLETPEDYFKSVRSQWRSMSLPNPHICNTTRFVREDFTLNKIDKCAFNNSDKEKVMSCDQFLKNRIDKLIYEINSLHSQRFCLPQFKCRKNRRNINKKLTNLQHFKYEIEKNREEIKQINKFYINKTLGWDANFLTRKQLTELQEQDKVLKHMESYYR